MGNRVQCQSTRLSFAAPLVLSLLLGVAAEAAAQPSLTYLDSGQWTFNQDVVVHGNLLATSLIYGLQMWDVADPANPVLLGDFYADSHRAHALAWEGDLVAMSSIDGTLFLIDVSDPSQPTLIDTISGLGEKPDVALRQDGETLWCYTAGNAGLDFQIRDLSNSAQAGARGALDLTGKPNSIAVSGDTVYVLAEFFGLYTVDVSDPDNPALSSSLSMPDTPHYNVSVQGSRAAVASRDEGFVLFDLSNPAVPVRKATVSPYINATHNGLRVMEVVVEGETLHVVAENVGLLRYDISDLDSPVLTGYDPAFDSGGSSYLSFKDGHLDGDRFYACHWSGVHPGVVIFDAGTGQSDYLGRTGGYDYVRHVDYADGLVYGCTGQMGVFAHELVGGISLEPRGNLAVVETWGVHAEGSLVYVASTTDGLVIGDFSDPDNPVRRGELDVGVARGVDVAGNVAFVAAYTDGLIAVDVSDPDAPAFLDEAVYFGNPATMASVNVCVKGSIAATADRAQGMNLWDISRPGELVHMGNYPSSDSATDVAIFGVTAYLVVENVGVHVLDISLRSEPALLQVFESAATGIELNGSILYVGKGAGGISAYRIDNPADPFFLCEYNTAHTSTGSPAAYGDQVYVADSGGLVVLELDSNTPAAIAFFDLDWDGRGVTLDWELGAGGDPVEQRLLARRLTPILGEQALLAVEQVAPFRFRARDERAVLAAGGSWNYTLESRDPGGDWLALRSENLAIEPAVSALAPGLAAYPNPFNPATTLRLWGVGEAAGRLELFDLSGRRMALLHSGAVPGGALEIAWDGRDDAGRDLASGVYLLRWAGGGKLAQQKLVLLR